MAETGKLISAGYINNQVVTSLHRPKSKTFTASKTNPTLSLAKGNFLSVRNPTGCHQFHLSRCSSASFATISVDAITHIEQGTSELAKAVASSSNLTHNSIMLLAELDPATAKVGISILGPFLSAFSFLFIARIVMSWYPKLPVSDFPYVIAYAPTEPFLVVTRKIIPPLGGVDVTPVVWFGLVTFLNEILLGPQGLLVLVSQQIK